MSPFEPNDEKGELPPINDDNDKSKAAGRVAALEKRAEDGIQLFSEESQPVESFRKTDKEVPISPGALRSLDKIEEEREADRSRHAAVDRSVDNLKGSESADIKRVDNTDLDAFPGDEDNADEYYGDSEPEYEKASRARSSLNDCYGCMYVFVTSVPFNFFIFLLIIANTLTLALYRYDQSERKTFALLICNEVFTWAFAAEMVLKIIGLGARNYAKDSFNQFDCVVVIVSLVDWSITHFASAEQLGAFGPVLSAFRALRLLRVIKLARLWGALHKILQQTAASLQSLTYYAALLFLFMFIFALLGMELFAQRCKYDEDDELFKSQDAIMEAYAAQGILVSPRENFDSIHEALTTIFIVIVGEDWNWVLYVFVRALGAESAVWYYLTITYFTLIVVIGNVLLFSLFTAILLSNFEGDMSEQIQKHKEELEAIHPDARASFAQSMVSSSFWKEIGKGFAAAFGPRQRKARSGKVTSLDAPASQDVTTAKDMVAVNSKESLAADLEAKAIGQQTRELNDKLNIVEE